MFEALASEHTELIIESDEWVMYKIFNNANKKDYIINVFHKHKNKRDSFKFFDTYHCGTECSFCKARLPDNLLALKVIHDVRT